MLSHSTRTKYFFAIFANWNSKTVKDIYAKLKKIFEHIAPSDVNIVHPPDSHRVPIDASAMLPNFKNPNNTILYRVTSLTPDPDFNHGYAASLTIVGLSNKHTDNPIIRLKRTPDIEISFINTDSYNNLQMEFPNNNVIDPYFQVFIANAVFYTVRPCKHC
jgi:hypothetical protein